MHPMPIKFFHGHDPEDEINDPPAGNLGFTPISLNAMLRQIVDSGQK
jgi:hypothetical protein